MQDVEDVVLDHRQLVGEELKDGFAYVGKHVLLLGGFCTDGSNPVGWSGQISHVIGPQFQLPGGLDPVVHQLSDKQFLISIIHAAFRVAFKKQAAGVHDKFHGLHSVRRDLLPGALHCHVTLYDSIYLDNALDLRVQPVHLSPVDHIRGLHFIYGLHDPFVIKSDDHICLIPLVFQKIVPIVVPGLCLRSDAKQVVHDINSKYGNACDVIGKFHQFLDIAAGQQLKHSFIKF